MNKEEKLNIKLKIKELKKSIKFINRVKNLQYMDKIEITRKLSQLIIDLKLRYIDEESKEKRNGKA